MKSLKLILIISGITIMLWSCNEERFSLTGLFWDPPSDIDVLYAKGAEKVKMSFGSDSDQTAEFKKGDTILQFGYRNQKLFYEYLQFQSSNTKVVFDSIVLNHHLKNGIDHRQNDTTDNAIAYYLSDAKSNYQFIIKDSKISVQRVWQY